MINELLEHLNNGKPLIAGSELKDLMSEISAETRKILGEANTGTYLDELEMRDEVENILNKNIPDTVRIWQPFYMDFGKNINFGENVFINANVHMQDQGGIDIGSNVFIGHQTVLATLDHGINPDNRGNLHPGKIIIEDNVWIGANVLITKGVTVGHGSIVAGGSVVVKDVPSMTIVGGNPAKVIKSID